METSLYAPLKRFFEQLGYTVKAEVHDCDLVAIQGEEMIVVEMKSAFNLALLLQGIERLLLTDIVYLAIEAPRRKSEGKRWTQIRTLCRRLGLGLMTVDLARPSQRVEVHCQPEPYTPRRNQRKHRLLLLEFHRRSGDFNIGGTTRRPIVTAYREDALRIARQIDQQGPIHVKTLREATGIANAAPLLQKNVYGWFQRMKKGVYALTPEGAEALLRYADVLQGLP